MRFKTPGHAWRSENPLSFFLNCLFEVGELLYLVSRFNMPSHDEIQHKRPEDPSPAKYTPPEFSGGGSHGNMS